MAKRKRADTGTDLVFEAQLWKAADALRSNMDAAQYKHVVLGLHFLKCDCESGIVGRVYKYLLAKIATVAGNLGGGFSALHRIACLLIEWLEPYGGRAYYALRT